MTLELCAELSCALSSALSITSLQAKSRAKIMRDICVNFRKVAQSPFGYATAVIQAWRDGTLARLRCHSVSNGGSHLSPRDRLFMLLHPSVLIAALSR